MAGAAAVEHVRDAEGGWGRMLREALGFSGMKGTDG